MPTAPLNLVLLLLALALLGVLAQIGLIGITFAKLGLSLGSALTLLLVALLGSVINLPLFQVKSTLLMEKPLLPPPLDKLLRLPSWEREGKTIIALNVGGGMVPLLFSAYLIGFHALTLGEVTLGIAAVTAIAYAFSRPVMGVGIALPVLVAPVTAAVVALVIDADQSAPLAYVSGTLGVLLGADVLRLRDIRHLGAPIASIGGAGTFDGIYLTGLVAVILA